MSTATDGFGTIISNLEEGGGGGGGGAVIQEGDSNIRANRNGEVTNGTFGEGASYNTLFGTGNGEGSFVAGTYNAILGGDSNYIDASYSVIAGGDFNLMQPVTTEEDTIYCTRQFIGGGSQNQLQQYYGFIGGGYANRIYTNVPGDESYAASGIVAGNGNIVVGGFGFIGGGYQNRVGYDNEGNQLIVLYSSVVGGQYNNNRGYAAFLGGGTSNTVEYFDNGEGLNILNFGVLVGGEGNSLGQHQGFLGGGKFNRLYSTSPNDENFRYSTLVGGQNNIVQGGYGFLGGGTSNRLGRDDEGFIYEPVSAVLVGGAGNRLQASWSVLVGGEGNSITEPVSTQSFLGGGQDNRVVDHHSFLGSGESNLVLGPSTVGSENGFQVLVGGASNSTYGQYTFLGGGRENQIGAEGEGAGGFACTISGGESNIIQAGVKYGTISGGQNNSVYVDYGTVLGGRGNVVGNTVEGGEASGLQAKTGSANYQRAYAGGQYADEVEGSRQESHMVFRGNTDGSDGQSIQLGSGGFSADPTFTAFAIRTGRSYLITAECVARGPDMTMSQVARGILHVDDDATEHFVAGISDTKISYGSPPVGWDFSVTSETGGLRVYFTVGLGNTQVVKAVASVRVTEVGVSPP